MRAHSQSDAGDPRARRLCGVARREARGDCRAARDAQSLSVGPIGRRIGNVKFDDPSLIEPVAGTERGAA